MCFLAIARDKGIISCFFDRNLDSLAYTQLEQIKNKTIDPMCTPMHVSDADGMDGGPKSDRAAILDDLRAQVRGLEGTGGAVGDVLALDVPPVDAALAGGGLPLGCLHEILGTADDGAATGFAALLLARLAARAGRPVLWLTRQADVHAPGLAGYGLTPDRLVLARGRRPADLLWALEEAARSAAVAAVVGEVEAADLTASRRLQLAAEAGGVTAFLLRRQGAEMTSSAVTRWRVAALGSHPVAGEPGIGTPCWQLDLLRCRGGRPGRWPVAWRGPAEGLALADPAPAPRHIPARRAADAA